MPTSLDRENRERIEEMRTRSVLGDFNPQLLDLSEGVILVCCADGDQIDELFDFMRDQAKLAGHQPRIHTITCHGGALLLSPTCTCYPEHNIAKLKLTEVGEARDLKHIHTVVLSVHAPCGKAMLEQLSLYELIGHMMRGKNAIKAAYPDVRVLCTIHVAYGDRKRTYAIRREDWDHYRGTDFKRTGEFSVPTSI